jgi:hypothetical protein
MLDRRTWESCSIDCTKGLGNIYGNGSQTCCPKGKTYRYAQLEELVQSVMIEHASEHEVICSSKPTEEKHREGETTAEQQPPRASSYEAATSSWGWWLGVVKTWTRRARAPLPSASNIKVVCNTSPGTTTRAARRGSLLEELRLLTHE